MGGIYWRLVRRGSVLHAPLLLLWWALLLHQCSIYSQRRSACCSCAPRAVQRWLASLLVV